MALARTLLSLSSRIHFLPDLLTVRVYLYLVFLQYELYLQFLLVLGSLSDPLEVQFFRCSLVRSALARLGVDERTSGYWFHDLMNLAIDTLPRSVMAKVIYGQSQSIKKRALKKMEKQK